MYINFHYFAVKTLCIEAEFNEEDAQCIAAYSQFVDDYDVWKNYSFKQVPDFARGLAEKSGSQYNFYTVTTGFTSLWDNVRLSLTKYQKEIVVPFHFIPTRRLKDIPEGAGRSQYRTLPADITGTFLIKELLDNARDKYRAAQLRCNLIRIGALLHTFADTYAHQMFSGFHGWENFSYLREVQDVFNGNKDIRADFRPDFYYQIASIGHTNVYNAPDMTYASWEMDMSENSSQKKKEQYTLHYGRSNVSVFCNAAEQIMKYLCSCLEKPMVTPQEWETIKGKLVRGFNTHSDNADELADFWHGITGYNYHYNRDDLWKNQLVNAANEEIEELKPAPILTAEGGTQVSDKALVGTYQTASDDFFWYNVIAKETRDAVIE